MPFLFVDYDHGAGGEYFCSCLSKAPQVEPLEFERFDSGRTKIQDVFAQEFLKEQPNPNLAITADKEQYTLVPSHRRTDLAAQLLPAVYSIRIQRPVDALYYQFFRQQQMQKVLLVSEPTDGYFLGFVKILSQKYNTTAFLSKINRNMDNLSLTLLAQGIEPTDHNRQHYLAELQIFKPRLEPDFQYNLNIAYEKLFQDPTGVADDVKKCFGIDVDPVLLHKYRDNFELHQAQN